MIQWFAQAWMWLREISAPSQHSEQQHLRAPQLAPSAAKRESFASLNSAETGYLAKNLPPAHRALKSFQWSVANGPSRPPATRVLITGRFADVCAELDRLAALEGA